MSGEPFLPLEALAAVLKLPRLWLRDEADAGRIPCLKIGRRRMFDLAGVRRALGERMSSDCDAASTERQVK